MKLSSTTLTGVTAKPSIFEEVDFLCKSDSNSFPTADKLREANSALGQIGIWIWQATGSWNFDDSNKTTLPIATADLIDGQKDYELPTDILAIRRVEIKNSSGDWIKLRLFDEAQHYDGLDNEDSGLPARYRLSGESLLLYPKPDASQVTTDDGLRIHLDRTFTGFDTSDADTTPGFAEPFHDLLSFMIAKKYFIANVPNQKGIYDQEIAQMKFDMQDYYAGRAKEEKPTIKRKFVSYE